MTRKEIELAVDKVAKYLNTNFVGEKLVLCGILKGAFIFITGTTNVLLFITYSQSDGTIGRLNSKNIACSQLISLFSHLTDLCRKLTRPYSIYFVEASSYTGQQQSGKVELLSQIVPSKFEGLWLFGLPFVSCSLIVYSSVPEQWSPCVLESKCSCHIS